MIRGKSKIGQNSITLFAALLILGAVGAFSQNEPPQRGSIPEELLRPRREEAPRYPVDTVIGALGQGQAPLPAYETAQKTAAALLMGNINAPVLAAVNRVFLENCMSMLDAVNPRYYRLGGGREEPDGSVSFLVRFIGREEGITGELFVRQEESRPAAAGVSEPQVNETEIKAAGDDPPEVLDEPIELIVEPVPEPPPVISAQRAWLFEDLILEEPRTREAENSDARHRFDFPPYERFY